MLSKFGFVALVLSTTSAAATTPKKTKINESQTKQQPNILFLFPDQWRFDWDGGNDRTDRPPLHLPNTNAIASQGVRFTHAYTPAPLCAPARACLGSGREYDHCGVMNNLHNDYNLSIPTFYTLLRDVGGYHTMTTGKDDLTKASQLGTKDGLGGNWTGTYHQYELGFSDGLRSSGKMDVVNRRRPHELYGHWLARQVVTLPNATTRNGWDAHYTCMTGGVEDCTEDMYPDFLYEDNWVAQNALTLLRRTPSDRPWFLQVSFPGPHPPFLVTSNMSKSVRGRSFPPPHDDDDSPPQSCKWNRQPKTSNVDRCDYGAEIENIDTLFGLILKELQVLGDYNHTIVCLSSDHGEMLGDHGDIGKSVPWEGSTSLPLVCMGPRIVRGKVLHTPVSTMDLAATFLDFAGVAPHPGMTSVSLRKFLTDTDAVPNASTYRSTVSSGLQDDDSLDATVPSEIAEGVTGTTHGREAMEPSSTLTRTYSWRMVVEVETGFKFICCNGQCPGSPSTVPSPNAEYMELLYNVTADPFDMYPLSGTDEYVDAMDRLRVQLPITPTFHCSKSNRNSNGSAHETRE